MVSIRAARVGGDIGCLQSAIADAVSIRAARVGGDPPKYIALIYCSTTMQNANPTLECSALAGGHV